MDIKTVLGTAPWLRRAWRAVPGPLRVPLLVVGAVVWLLRRRRRKNDPEGAQTPIEHADEILQDDQSTDETSRDSDAA